MVQKWTEGWDWRDSTPDLGEDYPSLEQKLDSLLGITEEYSFDEFRYILDELRENRESLLAEMRKEMRGLDSYQQEQGTDSGSPGFLDDRTIEDAIYKDTAVRLIDRVQNSFHYQILQVLDGQLDPEAKSCVTAYVHRMEKRLTPGAWGVGPFYPAMWYLAHKKEITEGKTLYPPRDVYHRDGIIMPEGLELNYILECADYCLGRIALFRSRNSILDPKILRDEDAIKRATLN